MPKTLNVYATTWCPHCRAALDYLRGRGIPFVVHDMDSADRDMEMLVGKANDGEWVVPTLEYGGRWIPGKSFSETSFETDLKKLGVL